MHFRHFFSILVIAKNLTWMFVKVVMKYSLPCCLLSPVFLLINLMTSSPIRSITYKSRDQEKVEAADWYTLMPAWLLYAGCLHGCFTILHIHWLWYEYGFNREKQKTFDAKKIIVYVQEKKINKRNSVIILQMLAYMSFSGGRYY